MEERELELQKLDEQQRVLHREHEETLQVLRASYECEKEALTHSFQEAKAALQVKGAGPCWSLCRRPLMD